MRPRTEVALALGALGILAAISLLLGSLNNTRPSGDPRRSVALSGPLGARGLANALTSMGVRVERLRRRVASWPETEVDSTTLVAVLDPSLPLDAMESRTLGRMLDSGAHIMLAGLGAEDALACVGYQIRPRSSPVLTRPAGGDVAPPTFYSDAILEAAVREPPQRRSTTDVSAVCDSREVDSVVPLLVTSDSQMVAAEFVLRSGGRVIALADGGLLTNRTLRDDENPAGPLILGLFLPRYSRVRVDEYHHGFRPSGSLWPALRDWSLRSPLGWALWQLAVVGAIALLAAGIRFGTAVQGEKRTRRSPLEHVKALAAALSAAKGHEVATRLLVQGLRRRLSRRGEGLREDPRTWLAGLARNVRTPAARDAAARLQQLLTRQQDDEDVLRAAHAVEDVWETLTPRK